MSLEQTKHKSYRVSLTTIPTNSTNKDGTKVIQIFREHEKKMKRWKNSFSPLCASCHPGAQAHDANDPATPNENTKHIFYDCPSTAPIIAKLIHKIDAYVSLT
jgi:hypothetical protein